MNSKELMLGEKQRSYQKGCQTEGPKILYSTPNNINSHRKTQRKTSSVDSPQERYSENAVVLRMIQMQWR